MATKKDVVDKAADQLDLQLTFNPLLSALKENDKKNLFSTNVCTAFIKTGFPVFDYYFGAVINIHDELGKIIKQEGRVGQAAGTFNLIIANTGAGKAQPLSTKIPTPTGYKLMRDIEVGDRLFGSNGDVYSVTGVFPQGVKDVYEITFGDGRKARCCEDHLWNVIYQGHRNDVTKTLPLKEIIKDYKNYSEAIENMNSVQGSKHDPYRYKYRIQTLSAPVQYDHQDVPIDPYVLGAFIGNGCLCEKLLSISSPNYIIPHYIAKKCGFELYAYSDKNYTWTFKGSTMMENILTDDFFGDIPELVGSKAADKHIPDIYLYNDYETRIRLLQGLMDTDGSISYDEGRYHVSYSSCSKRLLEQIQELIRSLGYNGNIYEDKRSEKYTGGYCGEILFQVPNEFKRNMFNISHKAAIANECINIKQKRKYEHIFIKDIKLVGQEECQCLMVDSPDHLYLTEDFIVTHNTTLAIQLAGNIIRQYKYSNAIIFDCEQRTDISRCENITKLPSSFFNTDGGGSRFMIKSGAVSLEVIQEMIVKLYASKMKLKNELTVNTGFKDEFGNDATMLQPTVIIIDSITTVMNETFSADSAKDISNAEKMRGNTEGARDAKTLKGFFKDILPLCKEANIIVYGINHINANMSMNAFIPVSKQQNFLKQDESIPGGKTMLYYPYNIIKLTAKPSDDFTEEADGFSGHIVMVEPIKSSSNQSGNERKGLSFEMVFSFKDGFDALRTMIWYGKNYGFIDGNKTRMKFKGDDSFTFTWKNIYQEVNEKPIWESLRKYVYPHLETHLSFMEPTDSKFDENIFNY